MKQFAFSLFLLLWIPVCSFAQIDRDQQAIIKNIDSYIEQVRTDWKIPGMGVVFIKDDSVIFSKGYGVKNLSKPDEKVDSHTLFQIGSVSKSFTAAVLAQLVDEGLLKWEDTVKNILPDFEMYDPWVSSHLQVKDLTSHRTGLGGQVGTYIPNMGYDRDDVYQMLRLLKPAYTFRGAYQYNNITFIPAAKIIEKLTGKSWEDNIQERIFDKLGMTESTFNGDNFNKAQNAALPYEFISKNGEMVVNPLYGDEQALWWLTVIGPAGSICCTPNDLIKWAQFHLNMGKVNGEQIISEKNMKYLHTGVTITSQSDERTTLYGHCWFIEQTKKGRLYFHTGTTWGMTTICFYIPEMRLGGTIQVNSEAPSEPRYAIMRRLFDLYLGLPDTDYNAAYLKEWYKDARKEAEKSAEKKAKEVIVEAPSASAITGQYEKDALFGDAYITLENEKLYITIGKKGWKRELKHINGNRYNFRSDGWGFDVTFTLDEKGEKATSFEVDFGEGEDFGPWTKISK